MRLKNSLVVAAFAWLIAAACYAQNSPPAPPLPASSSAVQGGRATPAYRSGLRDRINLSESHFRQGQDQVLRRIIDDPRLQGSIRNSTSLGNRVLRTMNRPTALLDKLPYGGGVFTNLFRAVRAQKELAQYKALDRSQIVGQTPFAKSIVKAQEDYKDAKRTGALVGIGISIAGEAVGAGLGMAGVASGFLTDPALGEAAHETTKALFGAAADIPQSLAIDQVAAPIVDWGQSKARGEKYQSAAEKRNLVVGDRAQPAKGRVQKIKDAISGKQDPRLNADLNDHHVLRGFLNWLAPPVKNERDLHTDKELQQEADRVMLRRQLGADDNEDLTDAHTLKETALDKELKVGWLDANPRREAKNIDSILSEHGADRAPILRMMLQEDHQRWKFSDIPRAIQSTVKKISDWRSESSSSSSMPDDPLAAQDAMAAMGNLYEAAQDDYNAIDLDDMPIDLDDDMPIDLDDLRRSDDIDLNDDARFQAARAILATAPAPPLSLSSSSASSDSSHSSKASNEENAKRREAEEERQQRLEENKQESNRQLAPAE